MDYIYIRAWGRLMGSYAYYIRNEVARAKADNAPADAVYRRKDHGEDGEGWVTFSELKNEHTREQIKKIISGELG